MSGLWAWLFGLQAVVDQVHEPAALVELVDGSFAVVERQCLPLNVSEGQRLRYRRGDSGCPLRFSSAPRRGPAGRHVTTRWRRVRAPQIGSLSPTRGRAPERAEP